MSLLDDMVKFCKDLILGDFEEQPGNAAMIIGGLVSLIPVVDQIMDVRDVSGMVYRINRKGARNCTKDDWVDLALAAFGCIPEVGSLFKTIIKPLWKGRKAISGALRGSAFIEAMLGKARGRAITFIKTFNWATYTQTAIQTTMLAMDTCDQFLGELSQPRWWVPDELEGLARDLRPGLQEARGDIRNGVQIGADALREFVTELVGEDGYRVVHAVATTAVASTAARPRAAAAPAARPGRSGRRNAQPSQQQERHPRTASTATVDRSRENGPAARLQRTTRQMLETVTTPFKALIGEHMGHYHHMQLHAAGAWPHGRVQGRHPDADWSGTKRLVTEQNHPATPTELVPEHLPRASTNGLDGVWSLGAGVYHFVEAKFRESAGAMFGRGADEWTRQNAEQQPAPAPRRAAARTSPRRPRLSKIEPPSGLTERQVALWCLLGQTMRGMQMGTDWLSVNVADMMYTIANRQNRFVYVFYAVPSASPPRNYTPAPGGPLRKGVAPGILEHITACGEVARRLITGEDIYDLGLHNEHSPTHGISDQFSAAEIDALDRIYSAARTRPAPAGGREGAGGRPADRRPPRNPRNRG